jgi:hypothetical protein
MKDDAATRTLEHLGYVWDGGQYWKPPLGPVRILSETARSLVAVIVLETDDVRLFPENVEVPIAVARKALIENLPRLTGVIAITDEEVARLVFAAHRLDAAARRPR